LEQKMPPRLSLSLPVYNGENFISLAIQSILDQDFDDFELIITDNASTDRTAEICQAFAAREKRIRYFLNDRNLGAGPNFNRGLHLASGEFFKWCACDDYLSQNFLGACVRALETNRDAVLAYGTTQSIDQTGYPVPLVGSMMVEIKDASPARRFQKVITDVSTCYEIFGVFRRDALRKTTLHRLYYGSDRALIAEMALLGKFVQAPDAILHSREHPQRSINMADKKARAVWHNNNSRPNRDLEHWMLLTHLIEIAMRHRQVAPLSNTLPSLFAWAMTPLQLSRYALELIGIVLPSARDRLRRIGWSAVNFLRKPGKLQRDKNT
jgi:glycosyltransferase involved in cell wall biosynthesis